MQLAELLQTKLDQLANSGLDARECVTIARRLIAFDPTHEGASRALMRAFWDTGERAQAVREFERCRSALGKALDVEPSPETKALCEAIRSFCGREGHCKATTTPVLQPECNSKSSTAPHNHIRLRVAVLPFIASPSEACRNLAVLLSQEIATALARFRLCDVIAPLSPARRSSDDVKHQQKNLTLDYVVYGTLLDNANSLQVSACLLTVTQFASPVWSDCFELSLDELHLLNKRAAARIVKQIVPHISRTNRKSTARIAIA